MNIQRAKEEIIHTASAYLRRDASGRYIIPFIRQRPILLMGPPGIGKTQIMQQIASECGLALVAYTITHHTRQSAIGLPYIVEKKYGGEVHSVTEYTMSEILASVYETMEASGKKEGLLFIDEINCVSETLSPTMLQFLQGKTFGNQKVPEGWIIVAAGNPPQYNRSVREFDVVTLDRVKLISIEPDFSVWKSYAYQSGIHGSVISYLDIHKENFYRMETTVEGKRFVTPRGWQDLSELIHVYEQLKLPVDREVAVQYLQHPAVSRDFASYLYLYYRYADDYRIDEILSGKIREGTLQKLRFAQFDERYEVTGLLLARLSENFRAAWDADQTVSELYGMIVRCRDKAKANAAGNPSGEEGKENGAGSADALSMAVLWEKELSQVRTALEQNLKAGHNEKELHARFDPVIGEAERYLALLRAPENRQAQGMDILREAFSARREQREQALDHASVQLEYAFDFMEAAFGESQEMVLLITGLSENRFASWFLKERDCDRFYMYNKNLLLRDTGAAIRQELEEIRSM